MFRKLRLLILAVPVFALLSVLFLPLAANAAASYYISGYTINAVVNPDGSADLEERITYSFSGQFNGALRDIDFSQTGGLVNQKVYVVRENALREYTQNAAASLDYAGKPGTYNFVRAGNLAHFKVFEPSKNEKKTFAFRYRLNDVVTKYNDIAEFNRKLIDTGWKTRLDNISITITLPAGAAKSQLRVFAHGPLTGESAILDDRTLTFTVPSVSPGAFVETLVLFPPALVPQAKNIVQKNALEGILANEAKLADKANRLREEAKLQAEKEEQEAARLQAIGFPLTILLFLLWLVLIIYIYLKYDRELPHSFEAKYYRELPGEYTPAEMSVLLSMGAAKPRDITATLMDLLRKQQLLLTVETVHKKGLFSRKESKKYSFSLNEKAPAMPLKAHEQYLLDWFIGEIGNGSSVDLDDIHAYVKKRSHALDYRKDYAHWLTLVKEEAAQNNFLDSTSRKGKILGILAGVIYVLLGLAIAALLLTAFAVLLTAAGIILVIFSARIKRRTAYGNEQAAMWQAFKNFLKDFSSLDKAEIPSVIIWEHYLVYAISLGVAKEVIRQLPLVFSDQDFDDARLTFMYGATYGHFANFANVLDDTIHTVEGTINSAAQIANSAKSSASGSGGGFSGGSSGGGGGGGGGGAF